MKRTVSIRLAITLLAFCLPLISSPAFAQQEKGKETTAARDQKPPTTYRIEFNIREIDGGKRVSSRSYMMVTQTGNLAGRIRVGNRVPLVQATNGSYSYENVGMNIDCTPREREDGIALEISVDSTALVPPDESRRSMPPVLREQRTIVDPIVTPGKPTLVATMDDVSSNQRFEIEVTVTRLK